MSGARPSATLAWLRSRMPTREAMGENRWLRPFAHLVLRSELWRFTRRSVPRAVALGIFLGITVPVAHSFIAALVAVFFGANVPTAFATTWVVSNPFTWVAIYGLAYKIGRLLLSFDLVPSVPGVADHLSHLHAAHGQAHADLAAHHQAFLRHVADIGIATGFGLIVEASLFAALGYFAASVVWRWRVGRRWHGRLGGARLLRVAPMALDKAE